MRQLYFVRHGLSEMNKAGLWSGQTETPLAEEGRAQAKAAGEQVSDVGIDHIIASPFSRTQDTALIIAQEIGYDPAAIELSSLLIERGLGVLEGQPWQSGINMEDFAEVEALDMLMERVRLAYEHIRSLNADTVLIVSHGATGRAFYHLLHPEVTFHDAPRFPNAEIKRLV